MAYDETLDGQPAVPVDRDLSGQDFGPYRVEQWVGSGGMGIVYRAAEQRSTTERVALKILPPYLSLQPAFVERFQREAMALRGLRHAHIVAYRDHGSWQGRHFLAMEFLAGESLEAALSRGSLSVAQTLEIGVAVASALAAAHAEGIVHRDLKPANIMLTPDGVKVVDFGIAHFTFSQMTLTRSNAVVGTVNYMAPEQRSEKVDVDHRADLFALGVVLYRSLTGELPIGSFERPSALVPSVSRRVDRPILKMLQRDPSRRQQSAREVEQDLRSAQNGSRLARNVAVASSAALALVLVAVMSRFSGGADPLLLPEKANAEGDAARTSSVADSSAQPTREPSATSSDAISPTAPSDMAEGTGTAAAVSPTKKAVSVANLGTGGGATSGVLKTPKSGTTAASGATDLSTAEAPKRIMRGTAPTESSAEGQTVSEKAGFYRVVDIAVGDVLNVRAEPDPASEKVAALRADQTCVRYVGQRRMMGGFWWRLIAVDNEQAMQDRGWQVRFAADSRGGAQGWVNSRYLKPQAADECRSKGDRGRAKKSGVEL